MANKLFVLLVLLSLGIAVFPHQSVNGWEKRYDGPSHGKDVATAIAKDGCGQVYVTGYSLSETGLDYVTIKRRSIGDTLWVSRYDGKGSDTDVAEAIAVDAYGYVYVTGRSRGVEEDFDYATIKYEPDGDVAYGWPRIYEGSAGGDDEAYDIALDGSGNVYVTGRSYGGETGYDYVTIKYEPDGDTAWVRSYDDQEGGKDEACAIAVDGSGNVYVTGVSYCPETSSDDFATIKYYSNGGRAWVRIYYGPGGGYDGATAIAVDAWGNVCVTGKSRGVASGYDYATLKYEPDGGIADGWPQRYHVGGRRGDEATAIAVDNSGNVYVTGKSDGGETDWDYLTIKYEPDGDVAEGWPQRYDGPVHGSDRASAVAVDDSQNVYVTGAAYHSSETSDDYVTIMYYPDGDTAWTKNYDGPDNDHDGAASIAVGRFNYVYVTGESEGGETETDYATIKYLEPYGGDVNSDERTDSLDLDYLWDFLYQGGDPPEPLERGDVNCSEEVDIGDYVYLNNYLYRGGPPPCE